MRLYLFEHCSVCFRVRMAAALKRLHLQETVVLEDDTETMVRLVGKRRVPILVKDNGQPMLESMDMATYIDGFGTPVLTGPQRSELAIWASETADKTAPLSWPRYPLLALPEFAGELSLDDIRVLPLLRSAAVVKGLRFPQRVRDYFETMMSHIGYQPLPAI